MADGIAKRRADEPTLVADALVLDFRPGEERLEMRAQVLTAQSQDHLGRIGPSGILQGKDVADTGQPKFAVAQVVAAAARNPPYDWLNNYISDLGNTACGMFVMPRGTSAFVCSPLHAIMNTSFVLSGLLIIAGTKLLWRFWPGRAMTTSAQLLWIISRFGRLAVGLAPENTNISLHAASAFNIPVGSVAILLLSLVVFHERRRLAFSGISLFILGLVGTVLSIAAQFAGSALLLRFGVGGMERVAGYPSSIWLVAVGITVTAEATSFGTGSGARGAAP